MKRSFQSQNKEPQYSVVPVLFQMIFIRFQRLSLIYNNFRFMRNNFFVVVLDSVWFIFGNLIIIVCIIFYSKFEITLK